MTNRDYTPCSEAWEHILDIIAENTPPAEPAEDDEQIEIAEEIDIIIEILRGGK